MKHRSIRRATFAGVVLSGLVALTFAAVQDKYTVKVPGGLAFSEFKGYEAWQTIAVSHTDQRAALILGNRKMIDALKAGIPGDGKPVPDGAMMAKIHWSQTGNTFFPSSIVPDKQVNVDFMVKDTKRFADSAGWGWATFDYDAATDTYRPGDMNDTPPQGNNATCGLACHTNAKSNDYVFTRYAHR